MFTQLIRIDRRLRGLVPRDADHRTDPRPPAPPRRDPAPLPRMRWHA